jgi:hypothetical protein
MAGKLYDLQMFAPIVGFSPAGRTLAWIKAPTQVFPIFAAALVRSVLKKFPLKEILTCSHELCYVIFTPLKYHSMVSLQTEFFVVLSSKVTSTVLLELK